MKLILVLKIRKQCHTKYHSHIVTVYPIKYEFSYKYDYDFCSLRLHRLILDGTNECKHLWTMCQNEHKMYSLCSSILEETTHGSSCCSVALRTQPPSSSRFISISIIRKQ